MNATRAFPDALADYERWVARAIRLIDADVALKHRLMADTPFALFRGSFFRWAERWPALCPTLARAPRVLGVADLHIENFGSWRDAESRLVWGVNDFDEAHPVPYTNDLVRLAVSVRLASAALALPIGTRAIASALLEGYARGLEGPAQPFVLAGRFQWLREAALTKLKDPKRFWAKIASFAPADARERRVGGRLARDALPRPREEVRVVHRVAGLGSLGRERAVALCEWHGGHVAREAKAMVASACVWAAGGTPRGALHYATILRRAARSPDPSVALRGRWLVRRLAPDGSRVELGDLPDRRDDHRLLAAMGLETSNIHRGSRAPAKLRAHLRGMRAGWLVDAMRLMLDDVARDYARWRAS